MKTAIVTGTTEPVGSGVAKLLLFANRAILFNCHSCEAIDFL
jgi:hypothetical protein